ncbi:hypothetical protein BC828DRAFT_381265 [Blastocladiella britannica]|nr:hypothetical protein BC828DRAFT_381265 [Blastocladiella britannica]
MSTSSQSTLRRATIADVPQVVDLINSRKKTGADARLFLPASASQIGWEIEANLITLVSETADGELVAYSTFATAPNTERVCLDPTERAHLDRAFRGNGWDSHVRSQFKAPLLQRSSTVFLERICFSSKVESSASIVAIDCLAMVFALAPRIQYIALASPVALHSVSTDLAATKLSQIWVHLSSSIQVGAPSARGSQSGQIKERRPMFEPALAADSLVPPYFLYVSSRKTISPPLIVRKARVEDCDDLVPLFKRHNMLPPDAGDYHVSEILENKQEDVVSLVAEHRGIAVAFLSASKSVDVDGLCEHFALQDIFPDIIQQRGETPLPTDQDPRLNNVASIRASAENLAAAPEINQDNAGALADDGERHLTYSAETAHEEVISNLANDLRSSAHHPKQTFAEHNAFAIHLFCIDEQYSLHSTELIKPLFDAFPGRNYCLLSQPTVAPEMPLLRAPGGDSLFTRVSPKPECQPRHCLYLAHRFGSLDRVRVRFGRKSESERVVTACLGTESSMSASWCNRLEDVDDEFEPVRPEGASFFVIESFQQIIGFAVVRHEDPQPYCKQFDVNRWVDCQYLMGRGNLFVLEGLVINPLFEGHARWVLQDVMILCEVPMLFYECAAPIDHLSIKVLREQLVPLRPFPHVMSETCQCPVWFICNSLLLEPRVPINDRLVFVGGSDCNVSAIEELVFNDHYRFTNLLLVSPEGLYFPNPPIMSRDVSNWYVSFSPKKWGGT